MKAIINYNLISGPKTKLSDYIQQLDMHELRDILDAAKRYSVCIQDAGAQIQHELVERDAMKQAA